MGKPGGGGTEVGAFSNDPQWLAEFKETERDGVIVASLSNTILVPTRFSKQK
jgi:hypothetical protein